jgi:hypothetical protein
MTETFTGSLKHLADGLKLASQHVVETRRKHLTDHQTAGSLHRLENVMRDCGQQIADALAAMPKEMRDRLDAIEHVS